MNAYRQNHREFRGPVDLCTPCKKWWWGPRWQHSLHATRQPRSSRGESFVSHTKWPIENLLWTRVPLRNETVSRCCPHKLAMEVCIDVLRDTNSLQISCLWCKSWHKTNLDFRSYTHERYTSLTCWSRTSLSRCGLENIDRSGLNAKCSVPITESDNKSTEKEWS